MSATRFLKRFFGVYAACLIILQPLLVYEATQAGAEPVADHVVINEVMPGADSTTKNIELFNPTGSTVSLDGWVLRYSGSELTPALADSPCGSIKSRDFCVYSTTSSLPLNNDGALLELRDETATPVDSVGYVVTVQGDSYARTYDAAPTWHETAAPTLGKTNGVRVALAAPTLHPVTSPTNQKQQTLSWDAVSKATDYVYDIATDTNFSTIVTTGETTATSVSIQLPGDTKDRTYYWRVTAQAPAVDAIPGTSKSSFSYVADITAPVITLDPKPSYTQADNLTGTIGDPHFESASYTVSTSDGTVISKGALSAGSFALPLSINDFLVPNGTYTLNVSAYDSLGNGSSKSFSIILANPLPKVTFSLSSSAMSATNGATMTISGGVTRPTMIQSLTIYAADTGLPIATPAVNPATGGWQYSFAIPSAGTYRYYIAATDVFGNTVVTSVKSWTISPYVPATTAIDLDSLTPLTDDTFKPVDAPAAAVYKAPILTNDQANPTIAIPSVGMVDRPTVSPRSTTPVEPSSGGWKIFGVTWYWWGGAGMAALLAYISRHKLFALLKK